MGKSAHCPCLDSKIQRVIRFSLTSRSYHLSGISCLSGRTAVYKTQILQDPEFEPAFVNEKWLGKYSLHSGDDKFITRWLVKSKVGWKMQLQNHKKCMLYTTFKPDSTFLTKQVIRWTRNTWRSDIRSIFIDRRIWRRYPYVAFNMIDKFINPLPILCKHSLVICSVFVHITLITFTKHSLTINASDAVLACLMSICLLVYRQHFNHHFQRIPSWN